MRRNVVSLGNRSISGEVGKVYAAGDVNIIDADVQKLNGAGDINIVNSYVAETKIAGNIIANNSSFGTVRSAGKMICKGLCKTDTLIVIGRLEAENLECSILRNFSEKSVRIDKDNIGKGTAFRFLHWDLNINGGSDYPNSEWDVSMNSGKDNKNENYDESKLSPNGGSIFKGYIKAETFENLCDFDMNFDYHFKNVISIDPLHTTGVLECEELYSFGILDMEGVNADTIYIHPYADSKLQQVMGSDIRITEVFPMDETFKRLPKSADLSLYIKASVAPAGMMQIESIEGDTIILDHVQAKVVSGENVTIGDCCIIDRVEYKGTIQVSPKASVKVMVQM